MATIRKSFESDSTADEMKTIINAKILSRKEVTALFDKAEWNGHTLNVSSKIGSGVIEVHDNRIDVVIELTLFGSAAKKTIETTLEKQFSFLPGKKSQ